MIANQLDPTAYPFDEWRPQILQAVRELAEANESLMTSRGLSAWAGTRAGRTPVPSPSLV